MVSYQIIINAKESGAWDDIRCKIHDVDKMDHANVTVKSDGVSDRC